MLEGTLLLLSEFPPLPMRGGLEESNTELSDDRLRVLVVDDEHLITDTICAILQDNGFDATGAYSGSDASSACSACAPRWS